MMKHALQGLLKTVAREDPLGVVFTARVSPVKVTCPLYPRWMIDGFFASLDLGNPKWFRSLCSSTGNDVEQIHKISDGFM
jgi:hypothetical protein